MEYSAEGRSLFLTACLGTGLEIGDCLLIRQEIVPDCNLYYTNVFGKDWLADFILDQVFPLDFPPLVWFFVTWAGCM